MVGAAAIAHILAQKAGEESPLDGVGHLAADLEARRIVCELLAEHAPATFDENDTPLLPDLNALGVRSCTECGCTDAIGCQTACSWVGLRLCSNCQK